MYFNQINRRGDPRHLFMDDLAKAITEWQQLGEQIILTGDFNTGDKGNTHELNRFWEPWLKTTGLINTHKQLATTDDIPSTHERGKVQIDYIFTSPGITVNRAGFLPFSKFPGDHRAIWIDVPVSDIIGSSLQSLSMAQARRLTLRDPRVVSRYLHSLKSLDEQQGLSNRLFLLSTVSKTQWTTSHKEEYHLLSHAFRSAMHQAEQTCRKFKTGAHPWSPQLDTARRTKFYWELRVKYLLGLHIPVRKLLKLQKHLGICPTGLTLQETIDKQTLARKEYNKVKRRSLQYRKSFREELASAIASHRNIKEKSALRELINHEETRDMHRRIKWMRKKYQSLSTSGVLISNFRGSKKLISDKSNLEAVIMAENEQKFHQTEGQCPLMEGTLYKDIGVCGTGPAVPDILAGQYNPPPGTCNATRSFLKACKQPNPIHVSGYDHLSYEHYCRAWSQAKQRTGSGKIHFGHWKAAIQDETISKAEWLLTTIPPKHGFSPKVWQRATDVMILKKEGILDLERLRTIVLYEADFNFFNKSVGRQVMDTAMSNGGMALEQYAKPRSSAQEQCLARRLIFDIVQYTRQAMAMASSDLKSCYDRIVHNAASLAMQKNGVSKETVTSMFLTIQNCQHYIRTAYGDSSVSYGGQGTFKHPPMGAGQGNGAGPQMWTVLSSVLFLAMHIEGFSTRFCQKMTKKFLSLTGFMDVDDMDLICIRDDYNKNEITEELQLTLSYWNRLVKVTGGALEPTKSGWYAFYQQWNPTTGQYEYKDLDTQGSIKARDKDGAKHTLPFISCHSSQEMIGVKMAPTGDQKDQICSLLKKAHEEAKHLCTGNLSETETRHAVVSSIFPRLAWCLPCMSLTQQDSKQLLRPILSAALSKMGIVSSLGYDYIHGSVDFQGLGIPELYHSGYATQIELLIDNLWKSTQTGHFLQMAIQEFILEAGSTQHPLLPLSDSRLDSWLLTQKTWFAALRSYIVSQRIRIHLNIPLLTPHRENDITIMDILDQATHLTSVDLKDINTCRLYKRVTLLSDITCGDGIRLSSNAWNYHVNSRSRQYQFNIQHFPSPRQWKAWTSAMTFINQSGRNQLKQPLGKWQLSTDQYFQYWDFFYDTQTKTLLQQISEHEWTLHPPVNNRTRQKSFKKQGTPISPPSLNANFHAPQFQIKTIHT